MGKDKQMKKILITLLLTLMVAILAVGPASAQKDKVNIKGEVVSVVAGTMTVKSNKGETFVVAIPAGFDMSTIQVGVSVLVKGRNAQNGSIEADSIKLVGKSSKAGDDDYQEKPEGSKDNSAFCADGKQEKTHPLAPKISERYGVTEEMVMGYFCEGYSIGAIMLAIKTSQLDGITSNPGDLLASRTAGNAWGQIWKGLGLIGSEKDGHSPPGLLKKPDHAGPKNKD